MCSIVVCSLHFSNLNSLDFDACLALVAGALVFDEGFKKAGVTE